MPLKIHKDPKKATKSKDWVRKNSRSTICWKRSDRSNFSHWTKTLPNWDKQTGSNLSVLRLMCLKFCKDRIKFSQAAKTTQIRSSKLPSIVLTSTIRLRLTKFLTTPLRDISRKSLTFRAKLQKVKIWRHMFLALKHKQLVCKRVWWLPQIHKLLQIWKWRVLKKTKPLQWKNIVRSTMSISWTYLW